MKRCIHCDSMIDEPNRKIFCSNWCAEDNRQPEENRSWKTQYHSIKDGVYEEHDVYG